MLSGNVLKSIIIWRRRRGCMQNEVVVNLLFIVAPVVGFCICSMFCCTFLFVPSGLVIILVGKRELGALLRLSSLCLVIVVRLFLAVPWVSLQFVIVVFPDHTYYFSYNMVYKIEEHYPYITRG